MGEVMSYQIGLDTINLRPTPRLAHTDYCTNAALKRALSAGGRRFEDAWDMDFIWSINDGPVEWPERGRTTDMGHAVFLEGGVDKREPKPCPFQDPEEVLAFDAVREYGLPDFDDLVAYYKKSHADAQRDYPEQLVTGGYYRTIISGAIEAFGWDMLLLAAAEPGRFERVLDSFFRLTLHHVQAWVRTSIEAFIQHDDFVWTEGAFVHPDYYRKVIIPRYAELWKVLHAAGKRVLFCSDGNFDIFVDDIIAAGADGLIFEPCMNLDRIVADYGKSHAIIGSKLDCRTLTFGNKEQIKAEIDATLKLAMDCPGFMFAVGNHIPSNVPVENAMFYMDYLRQHWQRV